MKTQEKRAARRRQESRSATSNQEAPQQHRPTGPQAHRPTSPQAHRPNRPTTGPPQAHHRPTTGPPQAHHKPTTGPPQAHRPTGPQDHKSKGTYEQQRSRQKVEKTARCPKNTKNATLRAPLRGGLFFAAAKQRRGKKAFWPPKIIFLEA